MSDFLSQFGDDSEFEGERWIWWTAKPLLADYAVEYAIFDPKFHNSKLPRRPTYPLEPCCATSRTKEDKVAVFVYSTDGVAGEIQKNAWEFIIKNVSTMEAKLCQKLRVNQQQSITQLIDEELEDNPSIQKHWKMIQSQISDPEAEVDRFYKLVGIVLASEGLNECSFVGFEFQTAWDLDHGLEIIMHKDQVLAKAGMTEICYPDGSMIDRIRSAQHFGIELDDFKLF